jgi:predicted PurR-regulated permease PerM
VDGILDKCEIALGGWVIGVTINMSVIALLSLTALLILGIPLAGAQAVLAGMLTFIPNIGPTLSVIPPIAIALLESPLKSVFVLIAYIVIQQIESNLLTPLVMAQQVSVLPALVLTCQVFFAQFFGFLGLLLSLPLTVVGQVWIKEVLVTDILDEWQDNYEDSGECEVDAVIEEPSEMVKIIDRRSPPESETAEPETNN